ncbi:Mediator of RNA polymerase II transcription subunit 6 [Thecaphora frezii]
MEPSSASAPGAPPNNLLHVQFKNPEYLSYLSALHLHALHTSSSTGAPPPSHLSSVPFDPQHPLTEYNALDYFATSPFFDRRSNNEQIRMQNIANGINPNSSISPAQLEHELKRFTGLEFVLVHAKPELFVIHRRWRSGPDQVTPLAAYYIINESIYQAPDLYTVLASRLQSSIYDLRTSLTRQRQSRATFNPRRGHHGRFINSPQDQDEPNDDQQDRSDSEEPEQPQPAPQSPFESDPMHPQRDTKRLKAA